MVLTLALFWNAHRVLWSISLVFISRRMMPAGALLWGRHPWAGSQRPDTVCGLRCFAAVGRQRTTPDDGFDSLCLLDTQGKGTNMVHEISCSGVGYAGNDACPEGSLWALITRLILAANGLFLS